MQKKLRSVSKLNNAQLITWLENEIEIANRLAKHYDNNEMTIYNHAYWAGRTEMAQVVIDTLRKAPDNG